MVDLIDLFLEIGVWIESTDAQHLGDTQGSGPQHICVVVLIHGATFGVMPGPHRPPPPNPALGVG